MESGWFRQGERNCTDHSCQGTSLLEGRNTESGYAFKGEGEVIVAFIEKMIHRPVESQGIDLFQQGFCISRHQSFGIRCVHKFMVETISNRTAGNDKYIGCLLFNCEFEYFFQVFHWLPPSGLYTWIWSLPSHSSDERVRIVVIS